MLDAVPRSYKLLQCIWTGLHRPQYPQSGQRSLNATRGKLLGSPEVRNGWTSVSDKPRSLLAYLLISPERGTIVSRHSHHMANAFVRVESCFSPSWSDMVCTGGTLKWKEHLFFSCKISCATHKNSITLYFCKYHHPFVS